MALKFTLKRNDEIPAKLVNLYVELNARWPVGEAIPSLALPLHRLGRACEALAMLARARVGFSGSCVGHVGLHGGASDCSGRREAVGAPVGTPVSA